MSSCYPKESFFSPRIAPPQQAVLHRSVASEEAKERRPHTHLRPWAVNRERQPHMRQTQTAAPSKSAGTPAVRDQTCLCVCVWLSGRAASRVKSRTAAVKRLSDGAERAQRSSLGGAAVGVSGGVPRQRSGFADASPTHKTVTLTPRIHYAHSCETLPSVNPKLGPHSRICEPCWKSHGKWPEAERCGGKFSPIKSNSSWSLYLIALQDHHSCKDLGQLCSNWQQRGAASNAHRKEVEETWRGRLRPNQLFTALDPKWESGRERLARCGCVMEIFHLINDNREVTQRSAPRLQRRRTTRE